MKRILTLLVFLPLLAARTGAAEYAVVNLSSAFMRAEPSYTSENVSQARMGVLVEVLDRSGHWVRIKTPEPYEGWVNAEMLAPKSVDEARDWVSGSRYICTCEFTHVFTEPRRKSDRVADLSMGNILAKGSKTRGRWVEVALPSGTKGWVRRSEVRDFKQWAKNAECDPQTIVSTAKLFIGVPYMWGGTTAKHFDCSGLVGFCWFMGGSILPRDATPQSELGDEIPLEKMEAGDLVFFGNTTVSHVGIAIDSRRIIHCSQRVKINSLYKDDPDYYSRNILHIKRIKSAPRVLDTPEYFSQISER